MVAPFKAVLFDLDDTLLDSYSARSGALDYVFSRAGITDITAAGFLAALAGSPFVDALKELAESRGIKENLFDLYRRTYWFENKGRLQLYPGIPELLEYIRDNGLKLGIVTSKFRKIEFEGRFIGCILELEETGIAAMFDVIVGLEDVENPKPHPDSINLALSKLRIVPSEALMVGDAAADIGAAKAAGCRSCYAAWGGKDGNISERADYTVVQPAGISGIIGKKPG